MNDQEHNKTRAEAQDSENFGVELKSLRAELPKMYAGTILAIVSTLFLQVTVFE